MDTFLAIASRRDERRYRHDPLPAELVARILDAGRLSGSSRNAQPWTFLVVDSAGAREALARSVAVPENVVTASLVVVVAVPRERASFDAGRAAQNMLLAAWNERVSSCPNGIVDRAAATEALGLSEPEIPRIVLTFGFPVDPRDVPGRSADEWSARANRRPLSDVVRHV